MSEMIVNDAIPIDKKFNELVRYNIFIMKIIEFVVALLLSILPHLVDPVDILHCLVSAPTLMLSLFIMVLYVVDQVMYEVEVYYCVIELAITSIAFINLFIVGKFVGVIYGLFYFILLVVLGIDLHFQRKDRGLTF